MNTINWFPGHMAKALREIKEKQNIVDCFIVLIDARVPLSSYNEELDTICPNKPRLFVFSKSDYANLTRLNQIIGKFNNPQDKKVIVNLKKNSSRSKIMKALNQILTAKREKDKNKGLLKPRLRCFVIGVPNVGKSTLINLLSNSKKTKVANFAGTTRSLQWIAADDIQLLDTPGILMPKLSDQTLALKLVACSLIKQDVINDQEFYYQISDILYKTNPDKFHELGFAYHELENDKYGELVKYARKNNFLLKNKEPNVQKVLAIFRQKILNLTNITWD